MPEMKPSQFKLKMLGIWPNGKQLSLSQRVPILYMCTCVHSIQRRATIAAQNMCIIYMYIHVHVYVCMQCTLLFTCHIQYIVYLE